MELVPGQAMATTVALGSKHARYGVWIRSFPVELGVFSAHNLAVLSSEQDIKLSERGQSERSVTDPVWP